MDRAFFSYWYLMIVLIQNFSSVKNLKICDVPILIFIVSRTYNIRIKETSNHVQLENHKP